MEALQDLYDSTDGTNWKWEPAVAGKEWDFSEPNANPCIESWQGITCSYDGGEYRNVVGLDLKRYQLAGFLPDSLSNLTLLESLGLGDNRLTGTIPAPLGSLSKLQSLDLSINRLRGTIPASLGNLSNLQTLQLNINRLRGTIPAALGNLSQLQELSVYENKLSGTVPASLGDLSQLQDFAVYLNGLSGTVPAFLSTLPQLQYLDIHGNTFSGTIPASLGNQTQLLELSVNANELTGTIPPSLGRLQLEYLLDVSYNRLTGAISGSLCNMSQLLFLDVSSNMLTGSIPACLGNLTLLEDLYIDTNKLRGTIPSSLGNLTQLQSLEVSFNQLTGTIPAFLHNLTLLSYLELNANEFTGTVPAFLGNLSSLTYLDISANKLRGTIPFSLGYIPELLYLYVNDNQLTGSIPHSLGNLWSLAYLDVRTNQLAGTIPETFLKLFQLFGLYMDENRLTGTLPSFLGSKSQLLYLTLANNSFVGTIPANIGNLSSLFELSLDNNYLSGTIPRSLAGLVALNSFSMYHNSLSGSLDGVFNSAVQTKLATVLVNDNQLTGTIPSAIFDLPSLMTLVASTNCFHGQLPANLCARTTLSTLVFDGLSSAPACKNLLMPGLSHSYTLDGSVHGTIPACLFQLRALSTLHLSGNGFTGSIAFGINATDSRLTDLSLSHNVLTGTIPLQLQSKAWAVLDLSFNRLRGSLSSSLATKSMQVNTSFANTGVNTQMSLSLENNRLSGRIPHSVRNLQNVSILDTNIFSCQLDGSDLPQHDSGVSNYQCGSSEFDVPYYVWLGLCCIAVVLLICALQFRSILQIQVDLCSWLDCVESYGATALALGTGVAIDNSVLPPYQRVQHFCKMLDAVSKHAVLWTAVILVVLLPLYAALSDYYGTHLQAYAWTVSAAYLSGAVPFGLEMVLWLILLCLAMVSMLFYCAPRAITQTSPSSASSTSHRQLALIYVMFLSINTLIVGGVNVAFVYVSIYRSSQLLTFAQICMSFFKVIYNGVASTAMLRYIVLKVTGGELKSSGYATLRVLSSLVNNIVIPFVVVMVVSPSCFYNVFAAAPSVSAEFSYDDCDTAKVTVVSCETSRQRVTSSYDPPFSYSYQCSSSLITYYAPAFVNLCIVSMFVMPMANLMAVEALRRADKSTRWFQLLDRAVPTTWKLPAIGETSDTTRTYFNPLREQLAQLNFVALIFTFGVVFPPLAAALAVTMVVCTVVAKLKLGRLLQHVCDHDGGSIARSVERACESLLGSALLRDFVGMLSVIACLFYTLFLFDTLGDAVGLHRAYWVLIVVPLLPVCAICAHWALGARSPLQPASHEINTGNSSDKEQPLAVEMAAVDSVVNSTETFNVILSAEVDAESQHRWQ